jgi:recombination protein RecA
MHQLKSTLAKINSDYGERTIFEISDKENLKVEFIPSETPVDSIIGGGCPKGRIIEVFGPEGSGKTTFSLKVVASGQKLGKCAFIDMANAVELDWARKLGVNTDKLILTQPDYAEKALDILKRLIESEQFQVIVVDDVASLVPKAEIEGEIGDANIGLQARLMSQTMRMIAASLSKSKTVVIFINQIRMKIGMWGNPETTAGGLALPFYAAVRLRLSRKGNKEEKKEVVGMVVKAKCVKNKVSSPFQDCEFTIFFDGIIK